MLWVTLIEIFVKIKVLQKGCLKDNSYDSAFYEEFIYFYFVSFWKIRIHQLSIKKLITYVTRFKK